MESNTHLVDVLWVQHDLDLWTSKKIMVAKELIQLGKLILLAMDELICQAAGEFTDWDFLSSSSFLKIRGPVWSLAVPSRGDL